MKVLSAIAKCCGVLAAALLSTASLRAQATFALHDGDRVVFLGDSITAQRFYTTYLQTAVHARFPEWDIRFYNAGVGGDNVFGGVAGSIDTRLTRDVLEFRPTVVTIMLGMNDRSHPDRYEAGYQHILQVLHEKAPTARITILGPTPVDGVTNNNPATNNKLRTFVEIDKRLAAIFHDTFVDLFHPVEAALERADMIDHLAALSLIPDRIHPQPPLHMLMAETILRAWGFPSEASSLTIDAATAKITHSEGTTLENLQRENGGLTWTQVETPDEVRFLNTDGNAVLYQRLLGATHPGAHGGRRADKGRVSEKSTNDHVLQPSTTSTPALTTGGATVGVPSKVVPIPTLTSNFLSSAYNWIPIANRTPFTSFLAS